jgi:hypothetical protein
MEDERKTYKDIVHGTYKDIYYEIVFWTIDGYDTYGDAFTGRHNGKVGTFNSYLIVNKAKTPELFETVKLRKAPKVKTGILKNYDRYDYYQLEKNGLIEISGGITYYSKEYDAFGNLYGIKIGNDYNHIWNTGDEDFNSIEQDIKQTIDKLLESLNRYNLK